MRRFRPRPGFTVVELLVIMVIVGLIAVLIIPLFFHVLETGRQKRTMRDMNIVGKAMLSWVSDEVAAAAAGQRPVPIQDYGPPMDLDDLETMLVPKYLPNVPAFDGWGTDYEYRINRADLSARGVVSIRSAGQDQVFSTDTYLPGAFDHRDYEEDLVWADGIFVRWPQRR